MEAFQVDFRPFGFDNIQKLLSKFQLDSNELTLPQSRLGLYSISAFIEVTRNTTIEKEEWTFEVSNVTAKFPCKVCAIRISATTDFRAESNARITPTSMRSIDAAYAELSHLTSRCFFD